MKAIRFILGSILLVTFFDSLSHAQQRTFVSGSGNDANPCTRTAPCRTFGAAVALTNAGGEVYVLDSAGYGAFTINKSISINAPQGVVAGISVFSGAGIFIQVATNDTVTLRGLTVNNQGSTSSGIAFFGGGDFSTLHIENCVVNGFNNGNGLSFLSQAGGTSGVLEVKDSIFKGNAIGINLTPSPGGLFATIEQVRLERNSSAGLAVQSGGSIVTVRNSVASANGVGFSVFSTDTRSSDVTIENCIASNNFQVGINSQSTFSGISLVRVSNSTVTGNEIGLKNSGSPAVLLSRGNNTVEGNGTDTQGTIGSYSGK